jgi:hypothetical protein
MNNDEGHGKLVRNIEAITEMIFDGFKNGSTCIPQILLKDGRPNGFRREETFPREQFQENDTIAALKKLLKSGYGKISIVVLDNKIDRFVAEETIKAVS